MRFEVPQFIEIEDKIFGPFTWKQFVYLCGGAGVLAVSYIALPFVFFIIIGVPVAGVAFLLAFYPINNRPFSIFLESVFIFYNSSNSYKWKKREATIYRAEAHTSEVPMNPTVPNRRAGGINTLSRQLELQALQKGE